MEDINLDDSKVQELLLVSLVISPRANAGKNAP